jgi:tricorn protease
MTHIFCEGITMRYRPALQFTILMLLFMGTAFSQQETRLLRFPAIHGNQLVFSYAGDLYTVSSKGGIARKLTGDAGYEMFARFSPDGKQIAFTAQYDGIRKSIGCRPREGFPSG